MKNLMLFSVLSLILFSCVNEPEEDFVYYKIKIDRIEAPDTLSVSDSLKINFYGTVGTDGCHSFDDFETEQNDRRIEITAWGKIPTDANVCPDVMVYLDGEEFKTKLNEPGKYQIIISQPDSSKMSKYVVVE